MKNLGKLALVLSIFLMVGCSKDMESRLPGTWDFVMVTSVSGSSTEQKGSMTFNDDGSGSLTPLGGQEQAFQWTSNADTGFTLTLNSAVDVYTNTKNKKKEQEFNNSTGQVVLSLTQD